MTSTQFSALSKDQINALTKDCLTIIPYDTIKSAPTQLSNLNTEQAVTLVTEAVAASSLPASVTDGLKASANGDDLIASGNTATPSSILNILPSSGNSIKINPIVILAAAVLLVMLN